MAKPMASFILQYHSKKLNLKNDPSFQLFKEEQHQKTYLMNKKNQHSFINNFIIVVFNDFSLL